MTAQTDAQGIATSDATSCSGEWRSVQPTHIPKCVR